MVLGRAEIVFLRAEMVLIEVDFDPDDKLALEGVTLASRP